MIWLIHFYSKQNTLVCHLILFIFVMKRKLLLLIPAYREDHHREGKIIESGDYHSDYLAVSKENENSVFESTEWWHSLPTNVLESSDPNRTAAGPPNTLLHVIIQTFFSSLKDQQPHDYSHLRQAPTGSIGVGDGAIKKAEHSPSLSWI